MDTEQAMRIVLEMAKDEWVVTAANVETTRQAIEEVESYLNASTLMDDNFWKDGYKVRK